MKTNERLLCELQPARDALQAWRLIRKHRQPIPIEVWEKILPLARTHGVNAVAVALRLNYRALRRKLGEPSIPRPDAGLPSFVEVRPGSSPHAPPSCVAELEDLKGRKMTLRFARSHEMNALALAQAFWKGGR
jgi:hypothetical protein